MSMLAVQYSINCLHTNYNTKSCCSWENHSEYILTSASNIGYKEEGNFSIAGEKTIPDFTMCKF